MLSIKTPAYVLNPHQLQQNLRRHRQLCDESGAKFYYSIKANFMEIVLRQASVVVDGFSTSSIFEARAAKAADPKASVHIVKPFYSADEIKQINELCTSISFNTIKQFERWAPETGDQVEIALRVNPEISFVSDDRYNPCRKESKLGIPLSELTDVKSDKIKGLHFHNNCESTSFKELLDTFKHIESAIPQLLGSVEWVNVGGGYFLNEIEDASDFHTLVKHIKDKYGAQVIFEPGGGVVKNTTELWTTVMDICYRDGRKVAMIDSSVNHAQEIFEYDRKPNIVGATLVEENAESPQPFDRTFLLAGATCLAGDLLGTHYFHNDLEVGQIVRMTNMGSYTFVKTHFFNGVNMPSIYVIDRKGQLHLAKEYTMTDFYNFAGNMSVVKSVDFVNTTGKTEKERRSILGRFKIPSKKTDNNSTDLRL